MSNTKPTPSFLIDSLLNNSTNEESKEHKNQIESPSLIDCYYLKPHKFDSHPQRLYYFDSDIFPGHHSNQKPHSYNPTNIGNKQYKLYGWEKYKYPFYPCNVYSYYSNSSHIANCPELSRNNQSFSCEAPPMYTPKQLQSSPSYHSSISLKHNLSEFDNVENYDDHQKKVVLSEESYLKLLESYRFSEEFRNHIGLKKKRKQRTIFTKHQTDILESVFNKNEYITLGERAELAKQLEISEKQVKIWFQNRRNKLKKLNSSNTNDFQKTHSSDDSDSNDSDDQNNTPNEST